MSKELFMYVLLNALIFGFCMWLAIRLADSENKRNTFLLAIVINIPFGIVIMSSVPGMILVLIILGILYFTLYDMELGQAVGALLITFLLYLLLGGIYLLVRHYF